MGQLPPTWRGYYRELDAKVKCRTPGGGYAVLPLSPVVLQNGDIIPRFLLLTGIHQGRST